jgi:hypothetical protein
MLTFKTFLAEGVNSSEFSDLSKKEDVRKRLAKSEKFDYEATKGAFVPASAGSIVSKLNAFRKKHPEATDKLYNLTTTHIGRGEILAYYIFNNITLGGAGSSTDLLIKGEGFAEVKEVKKIGTGWGNIRFETSSRQADLVLAKDIEYFAEKYEEITGEKLPSAGQAEGWKITEIGRQTLRLWDQIDLNDVAKSTEVDFPKGGVSLKLDKSGDIMQKGAAKVLTNVNKPNAVKPLKDLTSGKAKIEIVVDKKRATIKKIFEKWVETVVDKFDGKKFLLFSAHDGSVVGLTSLTTKNLYIESITKGAAKPIIYV